MENEIKSWLEVIFKEDSENLSVTYLGSPKKGDGYLADIIFVSLTFNNGKPSKDLAIKCAKRSKILRKIAPTTEGVLNEMYVKNTVIPTFTQFQLEKDVLDPFDSVPFCYGTLITEKTEILVYKNLKTIGYSMWDKNQPFTRKHIDLVMKEYAKLHSISIAMQDQQSKKFENLVSELRNVYRQYVDTTDMHAMLGISIDEIHDALKDELDEDTLKLWKSFKDQPNFIFKELVENVDGLKVILHGDNWGNNFIFKEDDKDGSLKVAMLDWQNSRYTTPICDLSYFLFPAISKEDIENLNDILEDYYSNLKVFTKRLGSDLDVLYPKDIFLEDWKKYCRYGILLSTVVIKVFAADESEIIDITEAAEKYDDYGVAFTYKVKNTTFLKNRAKHIVKYVIENKLIL